MGLRTYHDFVLFASNVEKNEWGELVQFTVRVFASPVGEGERDEIVRLPDEAQEIPGIDQLRTRARELERRALDDDIDRQMDLGNDLAKLLLPEYARSMFLDSVQFLNPDEGLRLRLRLPKELSDLPWEYMLVRGGRGERRPTDFIALNPQISIVRHEALAIPARWFGPSPRRRLLVVMATPSGYPQLAHLPEEQRLIKEALAEVEGSEVRYAPDYGEWMETNPIPGARPAEVSAALQEGVDVFHFSGHGEFEKALGPPGAGILGAGGIVLADEANQAVPVSADRLLEMIRGHGVRLVVLGACETARRDTVYDWSSVAVSLLKGEIPAVVAMQFTVQDSLAAIFMGYFYQALAGRMTIDEAVYLGRKAIRDQTLLPRGDVPGWVPDMRDWGAPVLYMRSPGGYIFPPITDRAARKVAEGRSNRQFQLQQATWRWAERGGTASPGELADQEGRERAERLEPTQALFLLHSSVAADLPAAPWLRALREGDGERLIRSLDEPQGERPAGPEETLRILGLDPGTLADWTGEIGPVARSAVSDEESVIRRTAALALLTLSPVPAEGLERVQRALAAFKPGPGRWWRRAELRGAMADADPEVEAQNRRLAPEDRLGAWLWRVRRRALRDHQRIFATMIGGALGAGIALGAWSMLLAAAGRTPATVYFFIYSYLGAILGLSAALGVALAKPTLLLDHGEEEPPGALGRRAFVLGSAFFAAGHFSVALLNALDLSERPWLPVTGALAGVGICAALYAQPQEGRRPGASGWTLRLAAAGLIAALAQWLVYAVGADHQAASFSFGANFYFMNYRRYEIVKNWMENTPGWEQIAMTADTAAAAIVLALGTLAGLRASPGLLAWWRSAVGEGRAVPVEKEAV